MKTTEGDFFFKLDWLTYTNCQNQLCYISTLHVPLQWQKSMYVIPLECIGFSALICHKMQYDPYLNCNTGPCKYAEAENSQMIIISGIKCVKVQV